MKFLKKTEDYSSLVTVTYTRVAYDTSNKEVYFNEGYKPNESLYWKIDGTTLYIRATPKEGYEERILYADTNLAKNGWWTASTKANITKAIIEERIAPTSCCRFFDRMTSLQTIEHFNYLKMGYCTSLRTMFQVCPSLTSIDLSNWDTSKVTDMAYLFSYCSGITSVGDLSEWKTSNVTSMRTMFQYTQCESLGDLSNWDTSKVTDMAYMFNHCDKLTSVGDLSEWKTSNVTDMSRMFNDCRVLTSVGDLSNWDTSKVTDMAYLFNYCSGITSLGDLSNWNVGNVITMSTMFQNCYELPSLGDLSNWNTSSVTNMAYMFFQCSGLTSVGDLSEWNTSKVTTMASMFVQCYSLTSVGSLSGWDTSKVINMRQMFMGTPVDGLDLKNWDISKVTDMYEMLCNFNAYHYLAPHSITYFASTPPIPRGADIGFIFAYNEQLTRIDGAGKISKSVSFSDAPLTHDSAIVLLNALDPSNVGTITLDTTTYATLSAEDLAIATNKGWTVAQG